MSGLNEHLTQVQDIVTRVNDFRAPEASDFQAFSRSVVEDLGVIASAVRELLTRADM